MDRNEQRMRTEMHLEMELNKIKNNYMKVWDEYYETGSRHSAFLKDLVDALLGISAVLEVYTEDKKIYPDYALEKLNASKSYIDENIAFFERQLKELNKEEESCEEE